MAHIISERHPLERGPLMVGIWWCNDQPNIDGISGNFFDHGGARVCTSPLLDGEGCSQAACAGARAVGSIAKPVSQTLGLIARVLYI